MREKQLLRLRRLVYQHQQMPSSVLPFEADHIPEDEGILGERRENKADAAAHPKLQCSFLACYRNPFSETKE